MHRNQSEIKSARYTGATSELRKRGRLVLGLLGHLEPGDVERRNGREPGRAFNEIGLEHQDVLGFGFDSRQFRSVRQIVLEKSDQTIDLWSESVLLRGSILSCHPAAPGLIPGIPQKNSEEKLPMLLGLSMVLVRGKWTEA